MGANNIWSHASHGTGKMCNTNKCRFYRVYKTSSSEFKRHFQSILPTYKTVVEYYLVGGGL